MAHTPYYWVADGGVISPTTADFESLRFAELRSYRSFFSFKLPFPLTSVAHVSTSTVRIVPRTPPLANRVNFCCLFPLRSGGIIVDRRRPLNCMHEVLLIHK